MKETLHFILTALVENPDDIAIDEVAQETRLVLTVHANPNDMGRIIGKNGRIIRAIRDLIKLMAAKQGTYVDVVLAEEVQ